MATEGLQYKLLSSDTYEVVDIGTATNVENLIIPSTYQGKAVTSIGDYAFRDCTNLITVTIPDSVTNIEHGAFIRCSSLTKITIPDGVIDIMDSTFGGCSSLTEITIPDSVTNIRNYAFSECSSLTEIIIPDSVTTIGPASFGNCTNLTSVTIGKGAGYQFSSSAFRGCTSLTNITVDAENELYQSVDGNVYRKGYSGLSALHVYAPGKTEKEFVIPDGVDWIEHEAFVGCVNLTTVTLPDTITLIRSSAFDGCTNLTNITLPDRVREIEEYAFRDCTNLTSITIGKGLALLNQSAFLECTSLTNITVDAENEHFQSVDGNLYTKDEQTLILYALGKTEQEFVIPDGVTDIESYAFSGCLRLKRISIGPHVKHIGGYAFKGCFNLVGVYITDLLAWCNISFGEYEGNPLHHANLLYLNGILIKDLTIPDGVTSIGQCAFFGCRLTSITIPHSVTSIGGKAFSNCWATSVTIPDSVTNIEHGAFTANLFTSITIPDSVTNIGDFAFWHCEMLTSITIPHGVTRIGNESFSSCYNLTSITIPNSVTYIHREAFNGSDKLTDIYFMGTEEEWNAVEKIQSVLLRVSIHIIPPVLSYTLLDDGTYEIDEVIDKTVTEIFILPTYKGVAVTRIGEHAFSRCSNLTSVTIPDGITTIGLSAFLDCTSLTNVNIPSSVTNIEGYAFVGCSFEYITIPEGIKRINEYTFFACRKLKRITIPSSVTSIDINAFYNCPESMCIRFNGTRAEWNAVEKSSASIPSEATFHLSYNKPWSEESGVIAKIQGFINSANEATGQNNSNLASAINALIEGYGQGYDAEAISNDTIDEILNGTYVMNSVVSESE